MKFGISLTIFFLLFFNSYFERLECKKIKLKKNYDPNEIFDTKELKDFRATSIEKNYNKKFHYYTIRTLLIISITLSTIALAFNLNYFWKPYTTALVANRELLKIFKENDKYFENHEIFENFNATMDKLRKSNEHKTSFKPPAINEDLIDFEIIKEKEIERIESDIEDEVLVQSSPTPSSNSSSTPIFTESESCKPTFKIINDDKNFFHTNKNSPKDSTTKILDCIYETEFYSNVKALRIHTISLSSSETSVKNNVRGKDGKIKLSTRDNFL
jgi:hypothetical protein